MRSLNLFGVSPGIDPAVAGIGNRPEVLRRKTIANNARLLIGAAALAAAPAVHALVTGQALPMILVGMVLLGGMMSLSLHHRRQLDAAVVVQVGTLMVPGLLLTLLDGALGDAGLAMALMGPIVAALVGREDVRRLTWLALAPVVLASAVAAGLGWPGHIVDGATVMGWGAAGFLLGAGIVCHSAHFINRAYEVNDKAQISAYRHLIEHVQDAVLRFASDGQILLASRSSETLFGCPRYQLTGAGLGDRLHVLDRPSFLTAFADVNQGGRSRTIEVRMRQDDARATVPRFIWVEIRFSPIRDSEADGGRFEVIALLRDITTRKDAETAMIEARRVAEDASQAKSRFLATIGHELRTPLNAVVGFSEMMQSGIGGDLSETHREYAGLIHQSGKHLLEVVRMLLDMSKIEAGKFEIQAEPFDPAGLVPACFSLTEGLAQERHVQLEADVEPELPALVADERVCRQVLINLLSNAIKFSNEGGKVTVSMRRQGQSINISVRDQGIGMTPEALRRIGEPFFQVQDGLARQYEGTGLGLSIVKGLVELHGGTLRAVSEVGLGTTMTVLLPINGPATKGGDTADILPLYREPPAAKTSWPNEKRKAL